MEPVFKDVPIKFCHLCNPMVLQETKATPNSTSESPDMSMFGLSKGYHLQDAMDMHAVRWN